MKIGWWVWRLYRAGESCSLNPLCGLCPSQKLNTPGGDQKSLQMGIPWPSLRLWFCHGSHTSCEFELTPWNLANGWRNTSNSAESFFLFHKDGVVPRANGNSNQRRYQSEGFSSCSCACVQDVQSSRDVEGVDENDWDQNEMWKIWAISATADEWQCWLLAPVREKTDIRAHEGTVAGLVLPVGQCHRSHQCVLFCMWKFTMFGQVQRLHDYDFKLNHRITE